MSYHDSPILPTHIQHEGSTSTAPNYVPLHPVNSGSSSISSIGYAMGGGNSSSMNHTTGPATSATQTSASEYTFAAAKPLYAVASLRAYSVHGGRSEGFHVAVGTFSESANNKVSYLNEQ
jgi:hypothetical protein